MIQCLFQHSLAVSTALNEHERHLRSSLDRAAFEPCCKFVWFRQHRRALCLSRSSTSGHEECIKSLYTLSGDLAGLGAGCLPRINIVWVMLTAGVLRDRWLKQYKYLGK